MFFQSSVVQYNIKKFLRFSLNIYSKFSLMGARVSVAHVAQRAKIWNLLGLKEGSSLRQNNWVVFIFWRG